MEGRIAAFEEGRDCLLVVIGGAESALDDGLALKGRGRGMEAADRSSALISR